MYKVAIQKNKTGEIQICEQDLDWNEASEFWWTEGNMSCDSNRHLEFERAKGREPDETELICGGEVYTALYAELPNGKKIKLD